VIVDYLKKNIALYKKKKSVIPSNNSTETATFYDKNTDKFLNVYGEVIQAFRTKNVNDYLDYTIESAELKDGQSILDAGCGVGGPASYFASKLKCTIQGLTISNVQAENQKK
jgi:cyclopropane fatty-acyl-phospholipid synthase-like methyltransferase